jgi:hypothetical protein
MSQQQQFLYSVSTVLPCRSVWLLFADLENWPKFSKLYDNLRWSGDPWSRGSSVLGTLHFPHSMQIRYLLETCDPGRVVSYKGYSIDAGIATHRIVRFDQLRGRTVISVDSYIVGTPRFAFAEGSIGFLQSMVERWFREFAAYCDRCAESSPEKGRERDEVELSRAD